MYGVEFYMILLILTVVDCGNLTDPVNGSVTLTAGTTFRQTAIYSCNTDYNLVGNSSRTCQATGEWSGSAPTCQSMSLMRDMKYFSYVHLCLAYLYSRHESMWKSMTVQVGPWVDKHSG